jgi:hypothetical protein
MHTDHLPFNSVNDSFDSTVGGGLSSSGSLSTPMNLAMTSMAGPSGGMYDMSPYNSFTTSLAQQLGPLQSAAHLGGPQSMPFPATGNSVNSGNLPTSMAQQSNSNYTKQSSFSPTMQGDANKSNDFDPLLLGDNSFAQFGGIDLSTMDGMHNPFGSLAGGYTMLSDTNNGQGAQPRPIPGRHESQQPSASGSFGANFIGGPSPADSTGSNSSFFAYTPAMMAADAAMGGTMQGSALGPVGGEGSRKKKEGVTDLQLPPPSSAQSAGPSSSSSNPNNSPYSTKRQ